ncbi:MAG: barstar family protein [Oscillospiraceae bacterium]
MKTLIIDAASIDSMYTIHDRFIAAFDFAECYGETLDSLHDYLWDK